MPKRMERPIQTLRCRLSSLLLCVLLALVACAPALGPETAAGDNQAAAGGEQAPSAVDATPTAEPPTEEPPTKEPPTKEPPTGEPEVGPQLCTAEDPLLTPLDEVVPLASSEFGEGIFSAQGRYTNPKTEQQFLLTASGQDLAYVLAFLQDLKLCFEALDTQRAEEPGEIAFDPEQDRAFGRALLLEKERNILVDMQWTPITPAELESKNVVVIYYVIDPDVDADGTDDFRAQCAQSKRVRPDLRNGDGSITATLYRTGNSAGSVNADAAGNPFPPGVSHDNSPNPTTYDARVTGVVNSTYWLQGTWTEGGNAITRNLPGCQKENQ